MVNAHGLAASIRASEESETFDLGGQNVATITSTMESAFEEPFELESMIRLTFVTGAGKQNRQKYDDGAAKAITSVLNQYGYQEDRGASGVMECAGSYKLQHDTGKNLKTVVVFPKVSSTKDSNKASQQAESLIPEDSPGYKIAVSSMTVFKNMVKSKCPSWSQKKGCLASIEALKEMVQDLDSQLIKGTPLTDSEQVFYDAAVNLDEKEEYVRQEMHAQVEAGNITGFEKELLLKHNAERIVALEKDNKPTAKALARKELLESIPPQEPHKLRNQAEIGKLRKELAPLLQLEDETRGRLLNIKETKLLARKDEILEEIEYLEETSRGWFEDDDVFESRVQASRRELAGHRKSRKSGSTATIDADTKAKVSVNKWFTPGEGRGFASASAKKKSKQKKGSVFGSMTMDSSDDDEDEDNEEEEEEATGTEQSESGGSMHKAEASAGKKKSKKKKKGNAKSKDAAPTTEAGESKKEETAIVQAGAFLQAYILPVLVAFLGWIVGLVFGKPKKRGGQQS